MGFSKARAAACDHVRDARSRDGNRVHVAFHQDAEIVLPQSFLGPVEVIQNSALRIDGRLRRIHVLGHIVAHGAAAERDHFPAFVCDGEHDAPPETVKGPAALIARDKSRRFQQLLGIFLLQEAE